MPTFKDGRLEEALRRVQAIRDVYQETYDENDVEGAWLDENGCLDGYENEVEHDACVGAIDALDQALEAIRECQEVRS